jgi:hypothetical protein
MSGEKRVKRNRKKNQRVRDEGERLVSMLTSSDPDVRDEARNRSVVDGRVFLGQTDYTDDQRILSLHASIGSKAITKCVLCESGKLATLAVFIPGTPVFSQQGKPMTFTYGLCRHHERDADLEAIEETALRIVSDALAREAG